MCRSFTGLTRMWKIGKHGFVSLLFALAAMPAFAEDDSPNAKLNLEMGGFSTPTFQLGSDAKQPLYQDSELNPEFIRLLQPYPEALAAAKGSQSYRGYATTGMVILTLGTVVLLMDTLNDAEDVSNDKLPDEKDNNNGTALALVLVGGAIGIVGAVNIRSGLNRAVDIYNEKRQGQADLEGVFRPTPLHAQTVNTAQFGLNLVDQNGKAFRGNDVSTATLMANVQMKF